MQNESGELIVSNTHKRKDLEEDEVELRSGDYWKESENGDIRLITSLKIIDNILHSVTVEQHPDKKIYSYSGNSSYGENSPDVFTIDDFLSSFMLVSQEEAKRSREEGIQGHQHIVEKASEEIRKGIVFDDGLEASRLLSDMSTQIKSDMSLPVSMAQDNTLSQVKEKIEKTKDIAKKQSSFITEKTSIISKHTSVIAVYYSEIAKQSMASIEGTLAFVQKLQQGVHTLDIFLGKGVNIYPLSHGKGSDSKKISYYQKKLYLDEEWWYHLKDGGVSFDSLGDFSKSIKEDFTVISERIAPSEKSVVLMQVRRYPKRGRYDVEGIGAFQKSLDDEKDREIFLLIRNGENVSLIFSEDLRKGERLFPTAKEINALFKDRSTSSMKFEGVDVDKYMNFKDLDNAEARDEFDRRAMYYQRIVLLLNGMHEREQFFGDVNDAQYRDWLSLDFQKNNFHFIYDDEDALTYNFVPLSDFVKKINRSMYAGSRVVGLWRMLADEDNALGMWSNSVHYEPSQIWIPIYSLEPRIVEKDNKGLFIKVECRHWVDQKKSFRKIYLDERYISEFVLCVDNVLSADIDFYINSRQARSQYVDFAELLLGARSMLRKEENENIPNLEVIRSSVPYTGEKEEVVSRDIRASISSWRIKHKWVSLPDLREDEKALKEIISFYNGEFFIKNSIVSFEGFLANDTSTQNYYEIRTDLKKNFIVYSEVEVSEQISLGIHGDYPFVKKSIYSSVFNRKKRVFEFFLKAVTQCIYAENVSGETVRSKKHSLPEQYASANRDYTLNAFDGVSSIAENVLKGTEFLVRIKEDIEVADALLGKLLDKRIEKQRKSSRRVILPFNIYIPSGFYIQAQVPSDEGILYIGCNKEIHVFELATTLNKMIAVFGSTTLFERLIAWIETTYSSSASIIASLNVKRDEGEYRVFNKHFIGSSFCFEKALPIKRCSEGYFTGGGGYHGDVSYFYEEDASFKQPDFKELVERKRTKIDNERREEERREKSVPGCEIIVW